MSGCERARDAILEVDLNEPIDPEVEVHLAECADCGALLERLEAQQVALGGVLAEIAATVAADVDPAEIRERQMFARRRRRTSWRVLVPVAAAALGGVAFFGPRARVAGPFEGGPEWALPVATLQSIQPVVLSSGSHSNVAVLPTDNPNITIVWFME
jgi:anti-sigma factor RsiW